jgi:hypothetical protein
MTKNAVQECQHQFRNIFCKTQDNEHLWKIDRQQKENRKTKKHKRKARKKKKKKKNISGVERERETESKRRRWQIVR